MKLGVYLIILLLLMFSVIAIVDEDLLSRKVGRCSIFFNDTYTCEFNPNQPVQEAICTKYDTGHVCVGVK